MNPIFSYLYSGKIKKSFLRNFLHISVLALWGIILSIATCFTSADDTEVNIVVDKADDDTKEYWDMYTFLLSDYDDSRSEMLAADVNQLGSLALNVRVMVKLTARQIYNTSVLWAKYAVRMIAEYIQHKSFINEFLNSNKFRVGMTGSHVRYLYQLCRIVI